MHVFHIFVVSQKLTVCQWLGSNQPPWPDLANFRHFGKILKALASQFFGGILSIGQSFVSTLTIFNACWQNFIVVNVLILSKYFTRHLVKLIPTDFLCRKRPLFQLSHNCCSAQWWQDLFLTWNYFFATNFFPLQFCIAQIRLLFKYLGFNRCWLKKIGEPCRRRRFLHWNGFFRFYAHTKMSARRP